MNARTALLILPALFSLSLVGCAAETETPDPGTTGTGVATGPEASASKPEVGFSCGGAVTQRSASLVETGLSIRCIGGGDGGTRTPKCGPSACAAQDVTFRYEPPAMRCMGSDVFYWNGKACIAKNTQGEGGMLVCKGNDCEKVYKTSAACESAHEACAR